MLKQVRLLRFCLISGSIYMVLESIVHFSALRLQGLAAFWPYGSLLFLHLFMILWASASLFMAGLLFILSTDPVKYRLIVKFLGLFALFHACILLLLSQTNYNLHLPSPNALLWLPNYSLTLRAEACLLTLFAYISLSKPISSPNDKT